MKDCSPNINSHPSATGRAWAQLVSTEKWGGEFFLNEGYFTGKSLKPMPPDALISAQNAPKCVWRPGFA